MAKDIGNLRTKLSFEKTGDSNLTDLTRDLKGIRSEMNNFRSSSRAFRTSTQGMRTEADILSRRFEVQKEKVAELKRRYDEAKNATGENSAKTKDLAAQYNNAQAEMNKTQQQLDRLNQMIKTQESRWTKLGNVLDKSGQKLQTAGRAMTSFGRSYTMRVTTPILGAAAAALKVGMDFEAGMSKVQAISGASGKDLESLTEMAKEMGANTKFSATEAAEGLEYMALAGWKTQEMLDGLPGILDLATAAGEDLGKTSDIVTDGLSAFGMKAKESSRFADVLAAASANANTDVSGLGAAFQYVGPVAGALGFTIEDTAKAIGLMSNAGVKGQKAGTALRTMLTNLSSPTDAMEKKMKKLGISTTDSSGEMRSLDSIMSDLRKSFSKLDKEQQAQAASTIFGKNAMSGALAIINASDEEYKKLSKSIKDSDGAAKEMADIMQDNAKGAMTEFKSALEGAGIAAAEHLIPAITDVTRKATVLVGKFGELDKEQQQNILKWLGITAAVGPAAIVLGQATTAFGGVLRVGGSVSKMLGRASGAGLVGRLGAMGGPAGVAVLAAAGIGALGYSLYQLHKENNKSIEDILNNIESRKEEIDAVDKTIESYEKLQRANKLSSDEVLRYMDIMTELEGAESEKTIEKLRKEQEELLKKSGFTNEEMDEFLRLNGEIVEKAPETSKVVSEQGNAYAETTNELKQLNAQERARLTGETQTALTSELIKQRDRIEEQKDLQTQLKEQEADRDERLKDIVSRQETIGDLKGNERRVAEKTLKADMKNYENLLKRIDGTKEQIEENDKQLDQFNQLKADYEQMVLFEAGIVAEQGKSNEAIKIKQKEIKKARDEARKLKNTGKITTDEYNEQIKKIEQQQSELDTAKSKIDMMNDSIDGTVKSTDKQGKAQDNTNSKIDMGIKKADELHRVADKDAKKNIDVDDKGKTDDINRRASADKNKAINLKAYGLSKLNLDASASKDKNVYLQAKNVDEVNRKASSPVTKFISFVTGKIPGFKDGTPHHQGGQFIAGEEGYELGRMGNRWELLDYGLYDRPKGYEVFTHRESKRILNAMKNIPKYAGGARRNDEAGRVVNSFNQQNSNDSAMVVLLNRIANAVESGHQININGREVAYATVDEMNSSLENQNNRRKAAWGG